MSPTNNLESLLQRNSKSTVVEKKLLLKKISEMSNLPTPSANMMKVMLLLRDEDVKIEALVVAIEKDQSMVAQILKLVNSGFYGLRKTVESVEHAIALLGIINIKQVVYSASIMEFFSDDEQLEWNHSYSTSVLMGNFIKENELPGINILPLAMLMHDLGKVVLRRFSPKKYQVALQHAASDKIPVFRIEDAMLQINHAEVGAVLLEKWDSAEEIVKPVLQHHMDGVPETFIFETALVQFINWIDCSARGIPCYEPSRELMNAAGIEEIDKNYWLNKQAQLISSIEGVNLGVRQNPSAGDMLRDSGTDTKSLEKRGQQKPQASASKDQLPFPPPKSDADGNDTAEIVNFPREGDHDTATISVPQRAGDKAPEPARQPPQITTRVNSPLLSGKEIALMKKTYKPPTEVAGPVESVGSAAPSSPEGGSETGNTPVSVELPMQVLKRKAPVVNVHPLPPQPDEEVAASQSEPSVPGVQRPTQVLSRKTGAPVPPPPKDAAHAVSQAPELKGEVVQAESQDSQPQAPELKTDTSPISKQGMDIAITTHASIDPVVSLNEVPKRKKGFFASLLDWFKKNS